MDEEHCRHKNIIKISKKWMKMYSVDGSSSTFE